jgi:hypothetical protein
MTPRSQGIVATPDPLGDGDGWHAGSAGAGTGGRRDYPPVHGETGWDGDVVGVGLGDGEGDTVPAGGPVSAASDGLTRSGGDVEGDGGGDVEGEAGGGAPVGEPAGAGVDVLVGLGEPELVGVGEEVGLPEGVARGGPWEQLGESVGVGCPLYPGWVAPWPGLVLGRLDGLAGAEADTETPGVVMFLVAVLGGVPTPGNTTAAQIAAAMRARLAAARRIRTGQFARPESGRNHPATASASRLSRDMRKRSQRSARPPAVADVSDQPSGLAGRLAAILVWILSRPSAAGSTESAARRSSCRSASSSLASSWSR